MSRTFSRALRLIASSGYWRRHDTVNSYLASSSGVVLAGLVTAADMSSEAVEKGAKLKVRADNMVSVSVGQ